jgi:hypothetical protein
LVYSLDDFFDTSEPILRAVGALGAGGGDGGKRYPSFSEAVSGRKLWPEMISMV